jgi:hypothetical protein
VFRFQQGETMKRIVALLLVMLMSVLFLSACASSNAAVARFVQLPDDAKLLILGLITSLLTALFGFVFMKCGIDLRGYTVELAAVLGAIVVTVLEFLLKLLAFIPDEILTTIIHLIVLAFSGYGATWLLSKFRMPGYRSLR